MDTDGRSVKIVAYLRREVLRTLAGLKTGLFSSALPEDLAGIAETAPWAAADETVGLR
jgi:hypothetical protein